MTNRISVVWRSILSLAILGAGVLGFFLMGTPDVPTQEPPPQPPPSVVALPAERHTDGISFEVDGVVVPYREIALTAQVSGKIQFRSESCRIGRVVKKGEVLVRIEPDDYKLEVRRLTEELTQADAFVAELEAESTSIGNQIATAEKQLEIDARLLKRNEDLRSRSAASSTEVDAARKSQLTTQNALQSLIDQDTLMSARRRRLEAAIALVQANLELAELNLSRTEIRAPIDGVVTSASVEENAFVQPGSTLFVLQDTSQLDVACKIYMRQMHWLWQSAPTADPEDAASTFAGGYDFPDTPATVVYELGDDRFAWNGVVDRYDGGGIDSQTRMVPCRVHVSDPTKVQPLDDDDDLAKSAPPSGQANPDSRGAEIASVGAARTPPTLMTGMFVKVRIHADPPIPLVRLPHEAIQPGNTIWIVREGRLKRQSISVASSTPDFVVAYQQSDGLRSGDLIVTSPLATPVEGMQVTAADGMTNTARGPGRGDADGWKGAGGWNGTGGRKSIGDSNRTGGRQPGRGQESGGAES